MPRYCIILVAAHSLLLGGQLSAQDPPELMRRYCRDEDPANKCPGTACSCTDDVFEVTFDGGTDSVFEYEAFTAGMPIPVTVVLEVKSDRLLGWSYGVRHDTDFLTIRSVTTQGTDMEAVFRQGFNRTTMTGLEDCGRDPRCLRPTEGGGFISVVVLDLTLATELPKGRHSISRADYGLDVDPGPSGVVLEVTDMLRLAGSQRQQVVVSIDNVPKNPRSVVDAWLKRSGQATIFRRGDPNGDGVMNLADAMFILEFLFSGGLPPGCMDAADYDDDDEIQQTDAINLLFWLFLGLRPPLPPGPPPEPCGIERSPSSLGCEKYAAC